ncbi:alpha-terpineol synthase, chloroplastic-like [Tasmannia lanceolata]|uniref:alpha-terpineol synthase, chloroplastic-like n=1 Tax=Tasmannia lanceolata TaxID=3420 RepID=UPI0040647ED2
MAESEETQMEILDMMKTLVLRVANMKEELTRLKAQEKEKAPMISENLPILNSHLITSLDQSEKSSVHNVDNGPHIKEKFCEHKTKLDKGKSLLEELGILDCDGENKRVQNKKKFDLNDYVLFPDVILPPEFEVPKFDMYDGMGCPRSHLRSYIPVLEMKGLSPEQIAKLFSLSLTGEAKKWFFTLNLRDITSLKDLVDMFLDRFSYGNVEEVIHYEQSHSTNYCVALKHKIQDLIDEDLHILHELSTYQRPLRRDAYVLKSDEDDGFIQPLAKPLSAKPTVIAHTPVPSGKLAVKGKELVFEIRESSVMTKKTSGRSKGGDQYKPASLVPSQTARRNVNMSKHITCILSTHTLEPTINRRSANYPQSFGDYDFIQSVKSDYTGDMYERRLEKLKEDVTDLIQKVDQPVAQLKLIDTLQRLGVDYHFKTEIKEALSDINMRMEDDLYTMVLQFRLLRQHGFKVSQDVFNGLLDENGKFMESLCEDIEGILSLYEASHLVFEGEMVLDEAKAFTTRHLKELKGKILDQNLKVKVEHALELPFHWSIPRLEARWYIETYVGEADMIPLLFEFAKLDYNMVQAIYQTDIKDMARWWGSLGLGNKLSFARDRLLECFLWGLGITSEPELAQSRKELTKVTQLITTIDDVYDLYGSMEELELFTDAVERWDVRAMEKLPEYMRICFLALFNTVNEMAYNTLKEQGWETTQYLIKMWAGLCKAYLVEAKWYNNGYMPALDEYLTNAWISTSGPVIVATTYFSSKSEITKEAMEYLYNYPNLIRCSSMIARLCNDLGTSTAELERGDVPKSIQCYMHETGALEATAREHIRGIISDMWKKINRDYGSCSLLPKTLKNAVLDFARIFQWYYQYGDGFEVSNNETKERFMLLLVEPISVME